MGTASYGSVYVFIHTGKMNEPQTLWGNLVSSLDFNLTWSPMHLGELIFLTTFFLFCAFSKRRGTEVGTVVVLSATYLVINQLCWLDFIFTTTWLGGEQIFDYSFRYFVPALSFYLGMIALVALGFTVIHILKQRRDYTLRKLISILIACAILMLGVTVSARTPIAFQNWLDSFESGVENVGDSKGARQ